MKPLPREQMIYSQGQYAVNNFNKIFTDKGVKCHREKRFKVKCRRGKRPRVQQQRHN